MELRIVLWLDKTQKKGRRGVQFGHNWAAGLEKYALAKHEIGEPKSSNTCMNCKHYILYILILIYVGIISSRCM